MLGYEAQFANVAFKNEAEAEAAAGVWAYQIETTTNAPPAIEPTPPTDAAMPHGGGRRSGPLGAVQRSAGCVERPSIRSIALRRSAPATLSGAPHPAGWWQRSAILSLSFGSKLLTHSVLPTADTPSCYL